MERSSSTPAPEKDASFLPENPLVQKAYKLARNAHQGQSRKDKQPYINHCLDVTKIIHEEWDLDDPIILSAALGHDLTEDTELGFDEVARELGPTVANIIEGVSEFKSENDYGNRTLTKIEKENNDKLTLKKVIAKAFLDIRVAVVKLGDRLHNMRTLGPVEEDKQIAKAIETAKVHTKLAEALGMWKVKTELEDLSFFYSAPVEFSKIKDQIEGDERVSKRFTDHVQTSLESLLLENNFEGNIKIRKGGYYELFKKRAKLALEGESDPNNFRTIDDIVSFRVIINSEAQRLLFFEKLISAYGKAVDYDKIDYYIGANRRDNGYEAIHLVVNSPHGPFEIALVTPKEEEFNNDGVVSLIRRGATEADLDKYKLKLIFTPQREIVFLNRQATGIDFAYALNPQLGAQAEYLLIDDIEHSLTSVLPNAAVVEIKVSSEPRRAPETNLLGYCLPTTAKIIESQLRLKNMDQLVLKGKTLIEDSLKPFGIIDLKDLGTESTKLICDLGCQTLEDIYYKIANVTGYSSRIVEWLTLNGVTKESLGLTTIRLTGENKTGLLNAMTILIKDNGGDITYVEAIVDKKTKKFVLKFVVTGLFDQEKNNEGKIKALLNDDDRFETFLLV